MGCRVLEIERNRGLCAVIESCGLTFHSSETCCVLLHVWGFRRMVAHTESETLAQPEGCDGIPIARYCFAQSAPDGLTNSSFWSLHL